MEKKQNKQNPFLLYKKQLWAWKMKSWNAIHEVQFHRRPLENYCQSKSVFIELHVKMPEMYTNKRIGKKQNNFVSITKFYILNNQLPITL